MATVYKNRVKQVITTASDAATVSLGAAVPGFQTIVAAGYVDTNEFPYIIEDGSTAFEWGTMAVSGSDVVRTVQGSSNSGSRLVLSGAAILIVGPTAEDYADIATKARSALQMADLINLTLDGVTKFTPGWNANGVEIEDPDGRTLVIQTPTGTGDTLPYRIQTGNSIQFIIDAVVALELKSDGSVETNGNAIWHAGNFDPSNYVAASEKGANNGVATLDGTGKVPSGQLPSFVDDIIEVANFAALPGTGESGKIYITTDDNKQYRWTGSQYAAVGGSDDQPSTKAGAVLSHTSGAISIDVQAAQVFDFDADAYVADPVSGEKNYTITLTNLPSAADPWEIRVSLTVNAAAVADGGAYTISNTVVWDDGDSQPAFEAGQNDILFWNNGDGDIRAKLVYTDYDRTIHQHVMDDITDGQATIDQAIDAVRTLFHDKVTLTPTNFTELDLDLNVGRHFEFDFGSFTPGDIQYIGGSQNVYANYNVTSDTVNYPTGSQEGDFIVLMIATGRTSGSGGYFNTGTHAGADWLNINIRISSYYTIVAGFRPAGTSFTWGKSTATNGRTYGICFAFRGVDPNIPVDVHNTGHAHASLYQRPPTITTTSPNTLVFSYAMTYYGQLLDSIEDNDGDWELIGKYFESSGSFPSTAATVAAWFYNAGKQPIGTIDPPDFSSAENTSTRAPLGGTIALNEGSLGYRNYTLNTPTNIPVDEAWEVYLSLTVQYADSTLMIPGGWVWDDGQDYTKLQPGTYRFKIYALGTGTVTIGLDHSSLLLVPTHTHKESEIVPVVGTPAHASRVYTLDFDSADVFALDVNDSPQIALMGALYGGVDFTSPDNTTTDLTLPTAQEGDYAIVFHSNQIDNANGDITINTVGYTQFVDMSSEGHYLQAWYKKMGSTPDTVVNVTAGSTGERGGVSLAILRNVDPDNFLDTAVVTATGPSGNVDPPEITTVTDNAWVIALGTEEQTTDTDISNNVPTGYTEMAMGYGTSSSYRGTHHAFYKRVDTAGVENPASWDMFGGTGEWNAASIAVRPSTVESGNYTFTFTNVPSLFEPWSRKIVIDANVNPGTYTFTNSPVWDEGSTPGFNIGINEILIYSLGDGILRARQEFTNAGSGSLSLPGDLGVGGTPNSYAGYGTVTILGADGGRIDFEDSDTDTVLASILTTAGLLQLVGNVQVTGTFQAGGLITANLGVNLPSGQTYNINGSPHTHGPGAIQYDVETINDTGGNFSVDLSLGDAFDLEQIYYSPGTPQLIDIVTQSHTGAVNTTIDPPAGAQEGDIILARAQGTSGLTIDSTGFSSAAGWYWKELIGPGPWTGLEYEETSSSTATVAQLVLLREVDTASPFSTTTVSTTINNGNPVNPAAITTVGPDNLVMFYYFKDYNYSTSGDMDRPDNMEFVGYTGERADPQLAANIKAGMGVWVADAVTPTGGTVVDPPANTYTGAANEWDVQDVTFTTAALAKGASVGILNPIVTLSNVPSTSTIWIKKLLIDIHPNFDTYSQTLSFQGATIVWDTGSEPSWKEGHWVLVLRCYGDGIIRGFVEHGQESSGEGGAGDITEVTAGTGLTGGGTTGSVTLNWAADMGDLGDWPAAVSATEVGYLDGVTSSIQNQLDARLSTSDVGSSVQGYSAVLAATTASFLVAQETKINHLTVTAATDLDMIRTRVNELDAAVILQGPWDASAGTFPGGGTAQSGHAWRVSVEGTVDGVEFKVGDRVVAYTDNASTTTYGGNWLHEDYTDKVESVAGKTGSVTLEKADITDFNDGDYATAAQGTNADTAHGWGDHAAAGYKTSVSEGDVTAHQGALSLTRSQITDANTVNVNAQTGTSYTGVLTDEVITMNNASANTFTIPTNASVAYPTGTILTVVMLGSGTTTVTGASGVTVNGVSAGSVDINNQYQATSLLKVATDTWISMGDRS